MIKTLQKKLPTTNVRILKQKWASWEHVPFSATLICKKLIVYTESQEFFFMFWGTEWTE